MQVFWNSPGCNGGPVRSVRIMAMLAGSSNFSKILETNEHEWNSENGNGSALIKDYEFTANVMYSWMVSVQYNFSEGYTWSQYSSAYYAELFGRKFYFDFIPFFSLFCLLRSSVHSFAQATLKDIGHKK